ncbi:hypothetical protein VSR01_26960 [Actinacidiphila sp. DG2A-62]|uniref:VMAP-C domain-containing protein n=1 Tax=Actinacidiphila sp. DG2A-62 TaxID=3108821 RepID=UPI002DB7E1B7|nr:hypothetical protein [Actinacidiphila sp. DG2A-62]MEC3996954.1 hypothetical protein [Actinacidiphila sp. DG2A-62]
MPGDSPESRADAAEILNPLVSAATVRIHAADAGARLLGSGFFIAPGWVLTCAHVALEGAARGDGRGPVPVPRAPGSGGPRPADAGPDLAAGRPFGPPTPFGPATPLAGPVPPAAGLPPSAPTPPSTPPFGSTTPSAATPPVPRPLPGPIPRPAPAAGSGPAPRPGAAAAPPAAGSASPSASGAVPAVPAPPAAPAGSAAPTVPAPTVPAPPTGPRVSIGYGDRLLGGVVEWSEPAAPASGGSWPAPDLALIRLLDPVDHPCVWITERTAKSYTTNQVAFFGWVPMDGEHVAYSGRCTISGQLAAGSGGILRLGNEDEMPHGLSGGPVVDLVRGEVIGVVKARRKGHDGGLAVGIQQLRRLPDLPGPDGDLYDRVMSAHDLYHADQHQSVHGGEFTWTDAHSEIGAAAGRALTPGQRTRLLGMLAQLPPPVGARGVQDIVTEVRGAPVHGLPVAPRAWRDGLGLLYDLRRGTAELESVLRYAVQAATAARTAPVDEVVERELARWAQETAAADDRLTRLFRATLLTERTARLRARALGAPAGPVGAAAPRIRTEALLEIIPRGWEPGRYDWRVCVVPPGGETECVAEDFHGTAFADLPERLAEPLAEAFRRCDEPGWTATLQLAVPGALMAFAADAWRLAPGGGALGAARPIVVRRTDPPADEDPAVAEERHSRWRALHRSPPASWCWTARTPCSARSRRRPICGCARRRRCPCCAAAAWTPPRCCTPWCAAATRSRCGGATRWTPRRCAPTSTAAPCAPCAPPGPPARCPATW